MLFFGLGTVPAMAGFVKGFHLLPFSIKQYFNKALPVVTFSFGIFMIYRGIVIDMPMELSFFEAIKNPVMCH
jgi:sulfite exporter TauE/SafE